MKKTMFFNGRYNIGKLQVSNDHQTLYFETHHGTKKRWEIEELEVLLIEYMKDMGYIPKYLHENAGSPGFAPTSRVSNHYSAVKYHQAKKRANRLLLPEPVVK